MSGYREPGLARCDVEQPSPAPASASGGRATYRMTLSARVQQYKLGQTDRAARRDDMVLEVRREPSAAEGRRVREEPVLDGGGGPGRSGQLVRDRRRASRDGRALLSSCVAVFLARSIAAFLETSSTWTLYGRSGPPREMMPCGLIPRNCRLSIGNSGRLIGQRL